MQLTTKLCLFYIKVEHPGAMPSRVYLLTLAARFLLLGGVVFPVVQISTKCVNIEEVPLLESFAI